MNKKLLLIGGLIVGGLGLTYYFAKKKLSKNAKIVFRNVKLVGKNILQKKFQLTFGIQNPTGTTAIINSITGDLKINGKIVADFSSFEKVNVKPNAETPISIIAKLGQGIISLLLTKGWLKQGVRYDISGTMNIDGILVPFDFSSKLI